MSDFEIIIPARAASTRLPGKMLLDVAGQPLIVHTIHQALKSQAQRVTVATDNTAIAQAVDAAFPEGKVRAVLTSAEHPSGTDRLAEAAAQLGLRDDQIVVNVQGDEPLMDPAYINAVAEALNAHPQAAMATCAYPITQAQAYHNPNVVKVVTRANGMALYFSRAPIPWYRDGGAVTDARHHVGLYAYRVSFLKQYPSLRQSPIEQIECLEQLRALWHGFDIYVHPVPAAPLPGVDTLEDLAQLRAYFSGRSST